MYKIRLNTFSIILHNVYVHILRVVVNGALNTTNSDVVLLARYTWLPYNFYIVGEDI